MNDNISKTLRKLEYGIYIVTMGQGKSGNAFCASWISQVSSEPPMIALAVKNKHQSSRLITDSGTFAVNIISVDQEEIAKTYYGPAESGYNKLDGVTVTDSPVTKSPILNGIIGYLDCKVVKSIDVGNHILFIGEVVAADIKNEGEILTTTTGKMKYAG